MRSLGFLLAVALAACGNVHAQVDAADRSDASAFDAAEMLVDAAADAGVDAGVDAPPPSPGQELTSAGGHVSGATFAMDVQVGHAFAQSAVQGATFRLEPSASIKP